MSTHYSDVIGPGQNTRDQFEAARSALDTALYDEEQARITAVAGVVSDLDDEIESRENAVLAETSSRQAADTVLQNNITAEATERDAQDDILATMVNLEILNRSLAIAPLATSAQVAAEAAARQTADSAIQTAVAAESTARLAALANEALLRTTTNAAVEAEMARIRAIAAASGGAQSTTLARAASAAQILNIGGDGTTVTVNFNAPHSCVDGDFLSISGCVTVASYNGSTGPVDVISTTQLTFLKAVSGVTETPVAGYARTIGLFVEDTAGFLAGQNVEVVNDDQSTPHVSIVAGVAGTTGGVITLADAVPITWTGDHKASIGKPVAVTTKEVADARGDHGALGLRLDGMSQLPGAMRLRTAPSIGATSLTLRSALQSGISTGYLIIDPFTIECEVRAVAGNAGKVQTIAALTYAHAADDAVLWSPTAEFNGMLFGVKANGTDNDFNAWKRAGLAVDSIGGGTIRVPIGTSIVQVTGALSSATWIGYGSNTTWEGYGPGSIIKVKNANGNFRAVFDYIDVLNPVYNVTFRNFTIDINGQNNPVVDSAQLFIGGNTSRFAIRIADGRDIRIENVTFLNAHSVNVIFANGTTLGSLWIEKCKFIVGGADVLFDQSVIYIGSSLHEGPVHINRNFFYASAAGQFGAGCAIEVHGSNQYVTDNYIENLAMGVYAASSRNDNIHHNRTIRDNKIFNALRGIRVLALYNGVAYAEDYLMANTTIKDNVMTLEREAWLTAFPATSDAGPPIRNAQTTEGIYFANGSDGTVHNLRIVGNTIEFLPYTTASLDLGGNPLDGGIAGIKFHSLTIRPGKVHTNVEICDNTILNSPASGIYFGGGANMLVKGFKLNYNRIYKPVSSPLPVTTAFPAALRVGIYLGTGNLEDAEIIGNQLIDDDAVTQHMLSGIYDLLTTVVNGRILDNKIYVATGTVTHIVHAATSTANAWYVRHRGLSTPSFWAVTGSQWTNQTDGRVWTQYTPTAGAGWAATPLIQSGTTGNRPSSPVAGMQYADVTINKPITYINGAWRDGSGASV